MKVYSIHDPRFRRYGTILEGYDFSELIAQIQQLPMPHAGITYKASDPQLEQLPIFQTIQKGFFGGMPVELGYCIGYNSRLNGLEYHRGSEVNVSATDYLVMIGSQQDLEEGFRYDTSRVEVFYVPAGLAVEFYATTLHYCACNVYPEGYRHATFLPIGTNTPLEPGFTPRTLEDRFLKAKNKWLMAHPEGGQDSDVPQTLYGPNWDIRDLDWSAAGAPSQWKGQLL